MIHFYFSANSSEQFITLKFHTLVTECSYDYVFVYDGDSFNAKLLGSFSGKTQPQEVVAVSGFVSMNSQCIVKMSVPSNHIPK